DKTQLATLVFSGKAQGTSARMGVFLAASAALVASTALGVLGGAALGQVVDPRWLTRAAGVGFLAIGAWTLWTA
ncbi:MAG: TMEM165/GDT1 family protein, partial [Myxococcales bacterium]|nr:TMEM165/GDT1 family protein [Myxococcales bacterium]